jgi:hypothetical protein
MADSGTTYRGWRLFFLVSGIWNLSGAVPAIFWPGLNLNLFYAITEFQDYPLNYYLVLLNRSFWIAVLVFGLGYLIIASNPGKHLGIVVMGIIGKVIVAVSWFYLFAMGKATGFAVFAAIGDSLFTVFFILYLVRGPRSPSQQT